MSSKSTNEPQYTLKELKHYLPNWIKQRARRGGKWSKPAREAKRWIVQNFEPKLPPYKELVACWPEPVKKGQYRIMWYGTVGNSLIGIAQKTFVKTLDHIEVPKNEKDFNPFGYSPGITIDRHTIEPIREGLKVLQKIYNDGAEAEFAPGVAVHTYPWSVGFGNAFGSLRKASLRFYIQKYINKYSYRIHKFQAAWDDEKGWFYRPTRHIFHWNKDETPMVLRHFDELMLALEKNYEQYADRAEVLKHVKSIDDFSYADRDLETDVTITPNTL